MTITILPGSIFRCGTCKKMVKGSGFLYNWEPRCLKCYKVLFPSFKEKK